MPEAFNERVGPVQTRREQGLGVGLARGLWFSQIEPWLDASNPERVDLSRPGGLRGWAGSGSRLLDVFRNAAWARGRQALSHVGLLGARFGFGSGTGLLVFFRSTLE